MDSGHYGCEWSRLETLTQRIDSLLIPGRKKAISDWAENKTSAMWLGHVCSCAVSRLLSLTSR